jgi:hypothetical protein
MATKKLEENKPKRIMRYLGSYMFREVELLGPKNINISFDVSQLVAPLSAVHYKKPSDDELFHLTRYLDFKRKNLKEGYSEYNTEDLDNLETSIKKARNAKDNMNLEEIATIYFKGNEQVSPEETLNSEAIERRRKQIYIWHRLLENGCENIAQEWGADFYEIETKWGFKGVDGFKLFTEEDYKKICRRDNSENPLIFANSNEIKKVVYPILHLYEKNPLYKKHRIERRKEEEKKYKESKIRKLASNIKNKILRRKIKEKITEPTKGIAMVAKEFLKEKGKIVILDELKNYLVAEGLMSPDMSEFYIPFGYQFPIDHEEVLMNKLNTPRTGLRKKLEMGELILNFAPKKNVEELSDAYLKHIDGKRNQTQIPADSYAVSENINTIEEKISLPEEKIIVQEIEENKDSKKKKEVIVPVK